MSLRFKPVYGFVVVLLVMGGVLAANFALEGGFGRPAFERVGPDRAGTVRIDVSDLGVEEVRFYRFLNRGNQEVKFFVGRDGDGELHVAFDACEVCHKRKRGFRLEGEWMVCNVCDRAFRLESVNDGGGGCNPIPFPFRVVGGELILTETDVLRGWRLYR